MLRSLALLSGLTLFLLPIVFADGVATGEEAPELPEASWVNAPEAETLEGLRGHLVLLHLQDEDTVKQPWPWLDLWHASLWKKGLRVLVLARADSEVVELAARQRGFAYAVAAVASHGAYESAVEAGAALLVSPDGTLAWQGKLSDIDTKIVAKLLRKVKLPKLAESEEAKAAWSALAARCVEIGAHALAVDVYDRIEKTFKGLPAEEAATESEKQLKRDKQAKREIAGAKALASAVADWLRMGTSDRRRAALVKKLLKLVEKHAETHAVAHARLLLGQLRGGAALGALRDFIAKRKINTGTSGWRTNLPKPPKAEFEPSRTYFWVLQTSEGQIRIKLLSKVAPMHVSSTIYLTTLGFYDGLTFHRVIPGFMAQGGDPLGTGNGNPGYKFDGEFDRSVRHDRGGLLSMANSGAGTDGSQFFITFKATRHLDDKHTIFGEVVSGMDTVKKLEAQGTPEGPTKKRLVIEQATIEVE